jgi:hypothetical protein
LIFSTICITLPASDNLISAKGSRIMTPIVRALLALAVSLVRSRVAFHLEILALRHQLGVYQRSIRRLQIRLTERLFWSWLSRGWSRWREVLVFVQPATVLAWQSKRFRDHWARLSQRTPGRPVASKKLRELNREISAANPQWGAPNILGELRKLGIPVAKSTIEKYRVRPHRPPSPAWRAFLKAHMKELVALDFFTVPTVGFNVLFVLIVLAHNRRKVVHFNVTEHPTAQWTAQQLAEAFPWETAPKYLLRDRDAWIARRFARYSRLCRARSSLSRKWVDYIIITSGWQHDVRGWGLRRDVRYAYSGRTGSDPPHGHSARRLGRADKHVHHGPITLLGTWGRV